MFDDLAKQLREDLFNLIAKENLSVQKLSKMMRVTWKSLDNFLKDNGPVYTSTLMRIRNFLILREEMGEPTSSTSIKQ